MCCFDVAVDTAGAVGGMDVGGMAVVVVVVAFPLDVRAQRPTSLFVTWVKAGLG